MLDFVAFLSNSKGFSLAKILVTGGLGTVGTVLSTELKARGNDVWFSDLSHYHDQNTSDVMLVVYAITPII